MAIYLLAAGGLFAGVSESTPSGPPPDAKRLMRLGGIDDAQWAEFRDGRPWSEPEKHSLQKIMLRLAGLPPEDVERLARQSIDWQLLTTDPGAVRGQLYRLRGRVRSIDARRLPADLARRFELKQYYRAEMVLDDTGQAVVVFARTVPDAWHGGGPIDQPGGAWSMFVKLDGDDSAKPLPVFAASRLALYPRDRLLGRLGMDVGLLDAIADRRPIRRQERECFYQSLAAAARARPGQLANEARGRLARQGKSRDSVEPLFNDPAAQRGKLVLLSGTARRVLRLRVEDPDIRRRFGIDHYYEIYLYTADSQGNPLVFCVTHLPLDMPRGDGPKYAEPVTVAGFFLKSWAYPSGLSYASSESARPAPLQLAPLLVGREAVWRGADRPAAGSIWGAVGGIVFVLILLGIWLWLRRQSRTDRRFRRRLPQRLDAPELENPGTEPDRELDFNVNDSPRSIT